MAEVKIAKAQLEQDADGEWRWRTLGGNGEKLGGGEAYTSIENARATLLAHIPLGTPVEELWYSMEGEEGLAE